jgi:hypothetical protein
MLVGTRSLHGASLLPRRRMIEVSQRYRDAGALAVTLARAHEAGIDGLLASPAPLLLEALKKLKRIVPLFAVVPALTETERAELEPGVEPLLRRRVNRAGTSASVRMALTRFTRPAALFGGNWATRLPVLIESELATLGKHPLAGVVLDVWITDLALAAGNARVFEIFTRFVRSRYRTQAGFETHNLGVLVKRLREWSLAPDFLVAPINPAGLGMKPTVAESLDALRGSGFHVVAKDLCAGGVSPFAEAVRYSRDHGAAGFAADLGELSEAGAELRAQA